VQTSVIKSFTIIVGILFLLLSVAQAQPLSFGNKSHNNVDLTPVDMSAPPIRLLGQNNVLPDPQTKTEETESTSTTPNLPNIGTSRPSFTDAVTTVPQGSLQAESGATYISNRGGTYSWTTPETLTRLGVRQNTELRFTVPNYTYIGNKQPGNLANNFGDISVGMSQHFLLPKKVDFAFIPILNIPTGANVVSSQALDPQLRLVFGKSVTHKLFLSSMFDTHWYTGKQATARIVMTPTLIGYYSFTKRLTGFLEYAALISTEGKSNHYAQTGALYVLSPRQQVDIRMAAGLNRTLPNVLVGFGYSFRIDGLFGSSRAFSTFKRNQAK
jgi:hypothetical protein